MLKKCTCVIMSLVMTFSLCAAISFAEVGSSGFQVTKKTLTEEEVPDVYVQYLIDQGLVDCIDYDNMERLITVSEFTNLINSVAVEVKDSCPYSLYHSDNDKTLYLDEAIKLLSDESSPEVKYIIEQWVAADMDTTSFLTMYDAIKLISTYRALCTDIDPTITYMVMEPVFLDPVEFNEKNPEEMKALQNSSILMTLRGQKNVQNSFQQIEKDIDNSMKMLKNGKDNFSKASPNTNSSPYGLTLGSNATYTTCNFWNYGLTSATGTVYSSYAAKALRARSEK